MRLSTRADRQWRGRAITLPHARVADWRAERTRIHRFVERRCWSQDRNSYAFYAGSDALDASVLLAAGMGYPADVVVLRQRMTTIAPEAT